MDDAATLEGIVLERSFLIPRSAVIVLLLLLMCTAASSGQKATEPSNSAGMFSVRATHVLGLEGCREQSDRGAVHSGSRTALSTGNQAGCASQ
jgi:hypothetical protein